LPKKVNQAVELWSDEIIDQKVTYIHNNPVVAGFVEEMHYWNYSSAKDYRGQQGMLPVILLW